MILRRFLRGDGLVGVVRLGRVEPSNSGRTGAIAFSIASCVGWGVKAASARTRTPGQTRRYSLPTQADHQRAINNSLLTDY
jgi:hypothetical protein